MRFWAQKAAYWRTVDRAKIPYERKYFVQINAVLRHAADIIVSRVESGEALETAADRRALANLMSLPLSEIYSDLYVEVGRIFGRAALRAALSGKSGIDLFSVKAKDEWDVWDPLNSPKMRTWTGTVTATRISNVSNRTAGDIRDLVRTYHTEGWDTARLVKEIRDAYGFSKERAQRIAQTEVNSAQNAASHFAIGTHVDTDLLKKQWLAVGDRRMRKTHEKANGQERSYEEAFDVGGAELMFPGDTSLGAPGKEIIRCRCVSTYSVDRRSVSRSPVRRTTVPVKPSAPSRRRPSSATGSSLEALTTRSDRRIPTVPIASQPTEDRRALASAVSDSLKDAPELLKQAVERGVNELGVVKYSKTMGTHYDGYIGVAVDQGKVKYSNPLAQAVRHEYGHHFDFSAKSIPQGRDPSNRHWLLSRQSRAQGGLGDAISEARKKLTTIRETNSVAWKQLTKQMEPRPSDSTASMALKDIFGTLSYGKVGGGHDRTYYIMNDDADSEVFANLFELTASGQGGKQLAVIGEYFPSLLDDFVAALRKAATP